MLVNVASNGWVFCARPVLFQQVKCEVLVLVLPHTISSDSACLDSGGDDLLRSDKSRWIRHREGAPIARQLTGGMVFAILGRMLCVCT